MLHPTQTEMLLRARLEDARRDAAVRRVPGGSRSTRRSPGERGGWWRGSRRGAVVRADAQPAPAAERPAPAPAIACSLDAGAMDDRVRRWQGALTAVRARTAVPGGVRLRFEDARPLRELGPLAVAEHECCPFFDFVISLDHDGLVMEVTGPELAQPLVHAVFGHPPLDPSQIGTAPERSIPMSSHDPFHSHDETALELAVVIASVRDGRFGPTVAGWFVEQVARRQDFDTEVLDLREVDIPYRFEAEPAESFRRFRGRLDTADAVVIVTPEYNHSYPASVKQAIDASGPSWHAKPVGFVSYGGLSGGLRAVEALRPVLAEVHATTVRDVVSLHSPWATFAAGEHPEGADAAAKVLLDRLAWWGAALRAARRDAPYAA